MIDYERPRKLLFLLVQTVAGNTLEWKEDADRELTALRNKNSELLLGHLAKLESTEQGQRKMQVELDREKRAFGEAAENKVLKVALAHVKKGDIFMGKCTTCDTKAAIIRGSKALPMLILPLPRLF